MKQQATLSTHARPPAARPGRPRWPALALLVGVAVALHALLLAGVSADNPVPKAAAATPALQVRTLPVPVPAPVADPVATPAPAPPVKALAQRTPARRAALPSAPVPAAAASAPAEEPAAPPPAEAVAEAPAAASAPVAAAAPAPPSAAGDDEIPVYQTQVPPPLTLQYDLHRGLLGGSGTLFWRPAGDHYEARLEARVAGLAVLTQVSEGGFDDAGLAPRRFTDQRMGREVRAANFQRERGLVTFSGPSNEFTLLVGTQDRLSWMIQLAAVVAAEPRRLAPGGKVALYVVGARADASMWVFRSVGEETVDTPGGPVRAVKFSREARGPYDTQADAWLDPARHSLPVRARLASGDSDALDLVLRDMTLPP